LSNTNSSTPSSVKFSNDSSLIAVGYSDSDWVSFFRATTGFPYITAVNTGRSVSEIDMSFDNQLLVSCGTNNRMRINNISDLTNIFSI
jgi:hypothetical protein